MFAGWYALNGNGEMTGTIGIARTGWIGADNSGDIFIAFSTANAGACSRTRFSQIEVIPNNLLTPLFEATIQATDEAILNALVAAQTMTGINGNTAHALPHGQLQEILRKYNRLGKRSE